MRELTGPLDIHVPPITASLYGLITFLPSVVFLADISDQNANDIIQLCIEVKEIDQSFSNVEDTCSSAYVYNGSMVAAELTGTGFLHNTSYHWQARVKDAAGLYSGWAVYGGNAENESDFNVDIVDPSVFVYDGLTLGADIEYNDGSLDTLHAVWELQDDALPTDIAGLNLWLDGSDVDGTGTDPSDGSAITNWIDKSGNGNDIAGTGAAVL